jgi:hypothetical protein
MSWQDWVLSGSELGFVLALIPAIRDESVSIPLKTSVPTAVFLTANAIAFSTLDLPITTVMCVLACCGWWAIVGLRSPRSRSERSDAGA